MGLDMYLSGNGMEMAYWRKANQIHGWFVKNVQSGEDDCGEYTVSREKLEELLELCKQAVKTGDTSGLPPTKGFFFGSDTVDDYYWEDLGQTVTMLENVLATSTKTFVYQSSW